MQQFFTIGRDFEFSIYLKKADGSAENITGRSYRLRLYPRSGSGDAAILDLAMGTGVTIGDGPGGRIDIAGGILSTSNPSYATIDLTRTDTGANLIAAWEARIVRAGTPLADSTSSDVVVRNGDITIQTNSGFGGPTGPAGAGVTDMLAAASPWLVGIIKSQSNGYSNEAAIGGSLRATNPDVYAWNNAGASWGVATLGTDPFRPTTAPYLSPPQNLGFVFSKFLKERTGKQVRFFLHAIPDTTIQQHLLVANGGVNSSANRYDASTPTAGGTVLKTQTLASQMLASSALTSAGKSVFDILIIVKGESDESNGADANEAWFTTALAELDAESWCDPSTVILIVEMCRERNKYPAAIEAWQRIVRYKKRPNTAIVSSWGLGSLGDGTHFGAAEHEELAERCYEALLSLSTKQKVPASYEGRGNVIEVNSATTAAAPATITVKTPNTVINVLYNADHSHVKVDPLLVGHGDSFTIMNWDDTYATTFYPGAGSVMDPEQWLTGQTSYDIGPKSAITVTKLGSSDTGQYRILSSSIDLLMKADPTNSAWNGGFESGKRGYKWGTWKWKKDNTLARTGNCLALHDDNSGGVAGLAQDIENLNFSAVAPGETVFFSFWGKNDVAATGNITNFRPLINWYDRNFASLSSASGAGNTAPGTAAFVEFAMTGVAPANAAYYREAARVNKTAGIVYIDDWSSRRLVASARLSPDAYGAQTPLSITLTADQNDWSPTGYQTGIPGRQTIRVTSTKPVKITGLAAGVDGAEIVIKNQNTDYPIWLEHQNTASAAGSRIILPQSLPAFLFPGDAITLVRNGTSSRWEVLYWPNQGMAMGFTFFDDFLTVPNVGAASNAQAGIYAAGTFGIASAIAPNNNLVNSTEKPVGMLSMSTGTDTNGRVIIGGERGNPANQILPAQGPAGSVARVARVTAPSTTDDYTLVAGFTDGHGGTWTDGAAWELRWTGVVEEWSQTTSNATTKTRSNSGSPTADATFIWLLTFLNAAWTEAYFIWSQDSKVFSLASTINTNLPSGTNLTGWGIILQKLAGTTSRIAYADLAGWRHDPGARG